MHAHTSVRKVIYQPWTFYHDRSSECNLELSTVDEMTLSNQYLNKLKHTRGEKARYLIKTRQNKVHISANFAFNTATYERTKRCKTTEMRMTYLDVSI